MSGRARFDRWPGAARPEARCTARRCATTPCPSSPRRCCCRPTPRACSRWRRPPTRRGGVLGRSAAPRHPAARRPARPAPAGAQLPRRRLRDRRRPRLRRRHRRLRRPAGDLDQRPRSPGSTANCTGSATRIRSRSGRTGALAGGLYGVALGGAFFGESMFSRRRDASKFALIALVARLRAGGFTLLDTQFVTDHLARLGAVEIGRAAYHRAARGGAGAAGALPARCRPTPAVSRCCSSPPRRRSAGGRAPRAPATRRTSSRRTAATSRGCRGSRGTR